MALLRRSRRPRRSLADPRQPAGEPPRAGRAPHLADQHRAAAAVDAGGVRLRLHHRRRAPDPARSDLRDAAQHAALPRPFLQLVRHAHARRRWRPRYISTVDSGNLAGYLVTLRAALLEIGERAPVIDAVVPRRPRGPRRPRRGGAGARRAAPAGPDTTGLKKELARSARGARPTGPPRRRPGQARLAADPRPHLRRQRAAARTRGAAAGVEARRPRRPVFAEAGYWLDQAAAAVAERMRDLERPIAAGRAHRARRTARRRSPTISSKRPSSISCSIASASSSPSDSTSPTAGSTRRTTTRWRRRRGSPAFVAIATGADCPRSLVQARAIADAERRIARAPLVERVDVRVPDAAARDADVSGHAAARDLRRRRPAADPVRRAARRAVGHLGVRVSRAGSRGELSIPRLRRARARPQARARRRSGHRAVRELPRGAAGARGGARQSRAPSSRRRSKGGTGSTRRSTTPPIDCRRTTPAASCCRPTWRTTRA